MPAAHLRLHPHRQLCREARETQDSAAQFSPPVPFYRRLPACGDSPACGEPRQPAQRGWHGGCRKAVDPPFGGLWCDQPALFSSAFRRPAARASACNDRVRPCGPGSGPDDSLAHCCQSQRGRPRGRWVIHCRHGGARGLDPGSIGGLLSRDGGSKLLLIMNGEQQAPSIRRSSPYRAP